MDRVHPSEGEKEAFRYEGVLINLKSKRLIKAMDTGASLFRFHIGASGISTPLDLLGWCVRSVKTMRRVPWNNNEIEENPQKALYEFLIGAGADDDRLGFKYYVLLQLFGLSRKENQSADNVAAAKLIKDTLDCLSQILFKEAQNQNDNISINLALITMLIASN